tara:strand:- start:88 stop:426 length:339 start_codon:yes stop_codon:yes gene_type:complete
MGVVGQPLELLEGRFSDLLPTVPHVDIPQTRIPVQVGTTFCIVERGSFAALKYRQLGSPLRQLLMLKQGMPAVIAIEAAQIIDGQLFGHCLLPEKVDVQKWTKRGQLVQVMV